MIIRVPLYRKRIVNPVYRRTYVNSSRARLASVVLPMGVSTPAERLHWYNLRLQRLFNKHQYGKMEQLLHIMKEDRQIQPDRWTYLTMLRLAIQRNDSADVIESLWSSLQMSDPIPQEAYQVKLEYLYKNRRYDEVLKLWEDAIGKMLVSSGRIWAIVAKTYKALNDLDALQALLKRYQQTFGTQHLTICKCIVLLLVEQNRGEEATAMYHTFFNENALQPDAPTVAAIMEYLFKQKRYDECCNIARTVKSLRFQGAKAFLETLTVHYAMMGRIQMALDCFKLCFKVLTDADNEVSIVVFNTIIYALGKMSPSQAWIWFRKQNPNIPFNYVTFVTLSVAIRKELEKSSNNPDAFKQTDLIKDEMQPVAGHYKSARERRKFKFVPQECLRALDSLLARWLKSETPNDQIAAEIKKLGDTCRVAARITSILDDVQTLGLCALDETTYNSALVAYAKCGEYDVMIDYLVNKLLPNNIQPTQSTCNVIMAILYKQEQIDVANKFFMECRKAGADVGNLTYALLIEMRGKHGDVAGAFLLLDELKSRVSKYGTYHLTYLFTHRFVELVLVNNKLVDEKDERWPALSNLLARKDRIDLSLQEFGEFVNLVDTFR